MNKKKAKFICLEGIDGAGKTYYGERLVDFLNNNNHKTVLTKEPGGTLLANELADLLLNYKKEQIIPQAELLIFFAARCQHIHHFIKPQLDAGLWVVCDRYLASSYAYQGGGRQLGNTAVANLEGYIPPLRPDLTLIFDIDINLSIKRLKSQKFDRFEDIYEHDKDFYLRVRNSYLEYSKRHSNECRVIDASLSKEKVWQNVLSLINNFL